MIKEDPLEKHLKISFSKRRKETNQRRERKCVPWADMHQICYSFSRIHGIIKTVTAECVSFTGREKHLALGDTSEWQNAFICGAKPKRRTDSSR